MGQMEMKCIFNIGKKYFYISQGYSGEPCGPWASCPIQNGILCLEIEWVEWRSLIF
jgi:hypothetical protein